MATVDRSGHQELYATLVPQSSTEIDDQIADLGRQWVTLVESLGVRAITVSAVWHLSRRVSESKLVAPLRDRAGGSPAVTAILHPPCCPTCQVSLELQILVNGSEEVSALTNGNGSSCPASIHVLRDRRGDRHIRIANVVAPGPLASAEDECTQIFEHAETLLSTYGAGLEHVVRTWIYLSHMARDYSALNRARCELFDQRTLEVYPASTGIGGSVLHDDRNFGLSLYAIVPASPSSASRVPGVTASVMHSETFSGPWKYGSYFARGMRVDSSSGLTLLLSGTASIDAAGETVGVGEFETQVERTLENLQGLLRAAGADFESVVQATSYLKNRADFDRYRRYLATTGFPEVPHSVVAAEICREELLVEIELIACV